MFDKATKGIENIDTHLTHFTQCSISKSTENVLKPLATEMKHWYKMGYVYIYISNMRTVLDKCIEIKQYQDEEKNVLFNEQ